MQLLCGRRSFIDTWNLACFNFLKRKCCVFLFRLVFIPHFPLWIWGTLVSMAAGWAVLEEVGVREWTSGLCPGSDRVSSHADAYERYLCLMFCGERFRYLGAVVFVLIFFTAYQYKKENKKEVLFARPSYPTGRKSPDAFSASRCAIVSTFHFSRLIDSSVPVNINYYIILL